MYLCTYIINIYYLKNIFYIINLKKHFEFKVYTFIEYNIIFYINFYNYIVT